MVQNVNARALSKGSYCAGGEVVRERSVELSGQREGRPTEGSNGKFLYKNPEAGLELEQR